METLFDHAPTPDELEALLGTSAITREVHESLKLSADTENGYLARLFMLRGDSAQAQEYLGRIPDPAYRFEIELEDALH